MRGNISAGEIQWAAEQADYVLVLEPQNGSATTVKIRALRELGERQMNATARNYYLTVAQSLEVGGSKGFNDIRILRGVW